MKITKTLRPLSGYSGSVSLSSRRSCLYSKRSSPISEHKCWEDDWSKDNINRFTLNDKNDGGVWAITISRWENHCWLNMTSRNIPQVSLKVKLLIRITMTSLVSDDRGKSTRHQGFRVSQILPRNVCCGLARSRRTLIPCFDWQKHMDWWLLSLNWKSNKPAWCNLLVSL